MAAIDNTGASSIPANIQTTYVTVETGDSVASIIGRFDTVDNLSASEAWVTQHNHLDSNDTIYSGQRLEIPVRR